MLFWLILFLVSGSTVYLLICRRDMMIVSNRRTPKVFMAMVGGFNIVMMAYYYGHIV